MCILRTRFLVTLKDHTLFQEPESREGFSCTTQRHISMSFRTWVLFL